MKIAFICQPWNQAVPPVQKASVAIWAYEVAIRLARRHDVFLYARRDRGQKSHEEYERVQFRRVSVTVDDRISGFLESVSRFRNASKPYFSCRTYYRNYIRGIARDLNQQHVDIIHLFNTSSFVPVVRAYNPAAKIVLHMHCEWLSQLDHQMILQQIRHADMIIGCSNYITQKIQQRFPDLAKRCHTVYNGVNPDLFEHRSSDKTELKNVNKKLLFIGRISPEKGLHTLLSAFEKVAREIPEVGLDIVGPEAVAPREFIVDLSDEPTVKTLKPFYEGSYLSILKNGLSQAAVLRVSFPGPVPHLQMMKYLAGSDILINPSLSEAFGMSLIEAMSSCVPVIATRVGGMQEIIEDGKTGLLVALDDAPSLADAILNLLRNDSLRRKMGAAGRERVLQCFAWDHIVENLSAKYEDMVDDQP